VVDADAKAEMFPAYAGMNREPAQNKEDPMNVPRIRGDEPADLRLAAQLA